ncbi:MAG: flavin reductase family protein [Caldilineales bacterium]|nr:flavin reductase family protein [Caldilineales bacterium]MDW8317817.1 flavin reductase family protein [Anaerolineae bacterium]
MPSTEAIANPRAALRLFQYGLHVLTCRQGDEVHGGIISWVTQVSLQPKRVAIAVRKDGQMVQVLREVGRFALNIVGAGQEELASAFFRRVTTAVGSDLAGYPWEPGLRTGAPLLLDTVAWLECQVVEEANAGGDHALFVAEVVGGGVRRPDARSLNLASTPWSYGG